MYLHFSVALIKIIVFGGFPFYGSEEFGIVFPAQPIIVEFSRNVL